MILFVLLISLLISEEPLGKRCVKPYTTLHDSHSYIDRLDNQREDDRFCS